MTDLGPLDQHLLRLIDGPAGPVVVLLGILVAFGVGAAHGLAPGHGKAMGAAYLVGARGRARDAVWLGVTVAGMHTGSVLVLALGLHLFLRNSAAAASGLPEAISPALRLAAAVIVMAVGLWLTWRSWRVRAPGGQREHDHPHVAVSPLSRRGLIALGVSGGLLPSPSAFLVLATAVFTGRTLFGLVLVAAFSVGLAATITLVGIAAVRGRDFLLRRGGHRTSAWIQRYGPALAAFVVLLVGLVLTVGAIRAFS